MNDPKVSLTSDYPMEMRDPDTAFNNAIEQGLLSSQESAVNYADHYMYMYSRGPHDYFKHRDTRRYLAVPFE